MSDMNERIEKMKARKEKQMAIIEKLDEKYSVSDINKTTQIVTAVIETIICLFCFSLFTDGLNAMDMTAYYWSSAYRTNTILQVVFASIGMAASVFGVYKKILSIRQISTEQVLAQDTALYTIFCKGIINPMNREMALGVLSRYSGLERVEIKKRLENAPFIVISDISRLEADRLSKEFVRYGADIYVEKCENKSEE